MSHAALALAALVGATAGFAGGRWAAPAADASVGAELKRLSEKLDVVESELRELESKTLRPQPTTPTKSGPDDRSSPATAAAAPRETPSVDPYASWTDDEIYLAAQGRGDDFGLIKAALRRNLPVERRVKLLLAKAAYCHKVEWHGPAEREALVEAVGLAPTTTTVGAEAMVALGYSYAAHVDDRWRCRGCFESVLRDAPNEEQRMKGAYGLAWLHDLGDERRQAAIDAYREFLEKWGEKWNGTAEVNWAKSRVAIHESAK